MVVMEITELEALLSGHFAQKHDRHITVWDASRLQFGSLRIRNLATLDSVKGYSPYLVGAELQAAIPITPLFTESI